MDSEAPATASAPQSRLDMSLDECIKLSGGPSSSKRKEKSGKPKSSKPREKTPRKAGPGTALGATGGSAGSKAKGAAPASESQNGTAGSPSAPVTDTGRAAGGISKKRRRSKKPSAAALAVDDNATAEMANIPARVEKQKNKAISAPAPLHNVMHDVPSSSTRATPASMTQAAATCRIAVSNLNETVSEEDIKELFGDVGPLVSAKLHLDVSGRSAGRAEVVFARMADALEAIKRYNAIPLDEMPLRITLATDRSASGDVAPTNVPVKNEPRYPRGSQDSRAGNRGPPRGRGRSQRGRPLARSPTDR